MSAPNVSVKILAENLAHAALEQTRRDLGRVKDAADQVGGATRRTGRSFGDLVRGHLTLHTSARDTRKGINALEDGMRALAIRATGVQGPIGQLSKGMLLLGGGGGAVLAVAAAVGTLALGFNALNKPVAEATTRAADFTKAMLAQAEAAQTLGERFQNMAANLRAAQGVIQAQGTGVRAGLRGVGGLADPLFGDLIDVVTRERTEGVEEAGVAAVLALRRNRAAQAAQAQRQAAEEERRRREREAARRAEEERKALRDAATTRERERDALIRHIRERVLMDVARPIGLPRRLTPSTAAGPPAPAPLTGELSRGQQVAAALGAIGDVALASRSGFGGVLNLAGGALSQGIHLGSRTLLQASPVLGQLLQFGGGLFSLFDRSAERRHKELIRTLQTVGEEVGLQRVRVVVVDAAGNVLQALRDLDDHDAATRVPDFAGVTG